MNQGSSGWETAQGERNGDRFEYRVIRIVKSGCGLLESQGLREDAVKEKHPPQDHLSDPKRNQGGRCPGGVWSGGLVAAPTSAISLRRE